MIDRGKSACWGIVVPIAAKPADKGMTERERESSKRGPTTTERKERERERE